MLMKQVIVLLCALFCCQFMTAQNARRDTVEQKVTSSKTKHETRKLSGRVLAALALALESEYDVVCDYDTNGYMIAMRNNEHFEVDMVTGEETPAPEYDKGKCACGGGKTDEEPAFEPKPTLNAKSKSDSDADYDYFFLRWE